MLKDLFSNQSNTYAKYRPTYPAELYKYILQFVEERRLAWDCATGNGQAAVALADYFEKVIATDISEAQIKNAVQKENIEYSVVPAEETSFENNSFDLITVAQAYHWINWKKFHGEAKRTGKSNAVVAIWSYNLLQSDDENLNALFRHFYKDITGSYWDHERRHIDDNYANVDFDFAELPSKSFTTEVLWTKEQLLGFFQSWSAVQHYIKTNGSSPLDLIQMDLDAIWNEKETTRIYFPIFLRMGRNIK